MTKPPEIPAGNDAGESATLLMVAIGVLEIFSDGIPDPWKRVRQKYPQLIDKGRSAPGLPYRKFTAESVLVWAAGVVAGDPAKQAMAARVFHELTAIALNKDAKPTVKLNALKLLGRECGMFTKKTGASGKIPIRKIRRVIVDPR